MNGFMNLDPLTVAKLEIYRLQEENKKLKERIDRYEKALLNTYIDGMTIDEILEASDNSGKLKCCICNKERADVKPYLLRYICKDCEDSVNRAYDDFYD